MRLLMEGVLACLLEIYLKCNLTARIDFETGVSERER